MGNVIIGLGNTGSQIVKLIASNQNFNDVELFAIDSVTSSITMNDLNRIKYKSIMSDQKSGSGRNRERGLEMYRFHESNGDFDDMYESCKDAKSPVIVITSAAGGTGSGSCAQVCQSIVDRNVEVVPIIICPNKNDPDAFHLNTNDLFIDLGNVVRSDNTPGVVSYATFENRRGDADYLPVNTEVMELIEIIFGMKYSKSDKDTIDDSDLDTILNTPGRFLAVSAKGNSVDTLKRELTRKLFTGFQPAFSESDSLKRTLVVAYALKSIFADVEYKQVFGEIVDRLGNVYDEYRNITNDDNDGVYEGNIIIAGMDRSAVKEIHNDYQDAESISSGISKSTRPDFMKRKKAFVREVKRENGSTEKLFDWGNKT